MGARHIARPLAAVFGCSCLAGMAAGGAQGTAAAAATSPWPLQLAMRVPFEPTAFPGGGHTLLIYELYLTNFESRPLIVERVDVLAGSGVAVADAARDPGTEERLIASWTRERLNTDLHNTADQIVGDQIAGATEDAQRTLAAGSTAVLYLAVELPAAATVPPHLHHRVTTADAWIEGAAIGTHHARIPVLAPPLEGEHWVADSGPGNESHHRRQISLVGGEPRIPSRYAIDWLQLEGGAAFTGDERDNRSYHAYGKPVLAVADARVIQVRDGIPENTPGHFGKGSLAVTMTPQTIMGNSVTLDLGHGLFAYYAHLQPGSLQVSSGQRVHKGQVLARVGDSGSSFEPHLHFEVTTSAQALAGEGVPYVLDRYLAAPAPDQAMHERQRELPLSGALADFPAAAYLRKSRDGARKPGG
jgi:hypothetical protein